MDSFFCPFVRSSRDLDNLSRYLVLPSKDPCLGKQRLGGGGKNWSRKGGVRGKGGDGRRGEEKTPTWNLLHSSSSKGL